MIDFIYVNILNEGTIPWLRVKGPVFGYKIGYGMYQIIKRDPRLKIEIVTCSDDIESAKKKYYDSKKESELIILHDDARVTTEPKKETVMLKEVVKDSVIIDDEVEITSKPSEIITDTVVINSINSYDDEVSSDVDELEIEKEIDRVLDENPVTPEVYDESVETVEDPVMIEGVRKYSEDELSTMTKAQMKAVLRERGYTEGPYSGKYHDTVEILKRKVLETQ